MKRCVFAISFFLNLFLSYFVAAAIIHVPADYTTIQAAIDAAQNGDTVTVSDGIYYGNGNRDIDFKGKAITVQSENGPTNCIIDASEEMTTHRAFYFHSYEDHNSVVKGFFIMGGVVPEPNLIWYGTLGGGGILSMYSSPLIKNCIFYNNTTAGWGGAIGFFALCDGPRVLEIENCTFFKNSAQHGGASAIEGSFNNGIKFKNCIFKSNEPASEDFYNMVNAKCGGVWTRVDLSVLESEWKHGANSIIADPCFVDANNLDFHLKSQMGRWDTFDKRWVKDHVTSPAIDFGDPNDDYSNEVWPNGKRINAGAYGNTPEASLSVVCSGSPADVDKDNIITSKDFAAFAQNWDTPQVPIRSDFNRDKKVDMSDLLILAEGWLEQVVDATLSVNSQFNANEPIVVSFENLPGNQLDWIGICKKGATIEPYAGAMIQWYYSDGTIEGTQGIISGSVIFEGMDEAGVYEARLFFNDSYEIKGRAFFTIN